MKPENLTDWLQPSKAEEVNRLCAEEMGYRVYLTTKEWMDDGFKTPSIVQDNRGSRKKLPDYCTDLNATRQLRESLTESEHYKFGQFVTKMTGGMIWQILNATPQQIAVAFLLTKGRIGGEG